MSVTIRTMPKVDSAVADEVLWGVGEDTVRAPKVLAHQAGIVGALTVESLLNEIALVEQGLGADHGVIVFLDSGLDILSCDDRYADGASIRSRCALGSRPAGWPVRAGVR